jgi:Transcriptional regulator
MQEIVQSVDRTLTILEVLSDYENGLGITEISERVELHKSTVHRLLNTLIYKGYIKQDKNTNKYGLTLKLFELGNKKVEKMDIVSISRPYLKELVEKTNEVVHLVVREGIEVMYVSKVEPQKSMKMYTRIGMRKPMYCTAMGKAMLSQMTEEEIEEIWNASDIKKLTDNTIVDLNKLKESLKDIRTKGYAMDEQEVEAGIRCVGTIVRDYKGEVCGGISLSSSIITFTEDKIEYFSKLVLEYASKISRELGYRG